MKQTRSYSQGAHGPREENDVEITAVQCDEC